LPKETKDRQEPAKVRIAELETVFKAKCKKIVGKEVTINILKKATVTFV